MVTSSLLSVRKSCTVSYKSAGMMTLDADCDSKSEAKAKIACVDTEVFQKGLAHRDRHLGIPTNHA